MIVPIILVVCFVAIWWLSNYFSTAAVISRKLRNTKAASIMTCKDNDVVRLTGQVERYESMLVAPLSKRECVYYQVIVEAHGNSARSDEWETIIHSERAVNFFLAEKESNKKALISTHRVMNQLGHCEIYESGELTEAERINLEQFLARHGHSSRGFLGISRTMRYFESVLLIGDQVSVAGKSLWKNGAELGFPGKEKILYLKAIDEKTPLFLSNDADALK